MTEVTADVETWRYAVNCQCSPAEAYHGVAGGVDIVPDAPGPCKCRRRFSVVIPAYNEEAFIAGSLESIIAQDFAGPFEIIVVDNNSTDGTARVARAHDVVVVREERQGVCWARQRGTEMATGEIIVSADADTIYDRGWLSRIDREFRADSGRVAVVGPFRFTDAPWWGSAWTWALFGFVFIVSRLTKKVPYVAAANLAFRRTDWPGYNTYATQGGDELDLLRRLQARGTVAFIPDNPVYTSSRRLSRGFVYNVLVTVLFYYFLGYTLNRLARRSVVGMAPACRPTAPEKPRWRWQIVSLCACLVLLLVFARFGHVTRFGHEMQFGHEIRLLSHYIH
jgi:glycosyltransferase involved in cell wall biosynthesis